MINRLVLADRFIEAQLEKRADIIGAWVGGSTARGEDTDASDIDVSLVITDESNQRLGARDGIDGWQDGIYYDAGYLSASNFATLETVMQNPFWATTMNHALLRHDPSGHFAQLQQAVLAVYMQPQWVAKRLQHWFDIVRIHVTGLQEGILADDPLAICQAQGWISFSVAPIPLLHAGIAPSSTRSLIQLSTVSASLRAQICAFEGSSTLTSEEVHALTPLLHEWMAFVDITKYGHLGDYFAKKAIWMARQGLPQEALHCMLLVTGTVAGDCRADATKAAPITALARRWLVATHWTEEATLQEKVPLAQSLLQAMENLAADLPAST